MLQATASIGDGRPVDLFGLGGNLDRRALVVVLAASARSARRRRSSSQWSN